MNEARQLRPSTNLWVIALIAALVGAAPAIDLMASEPHPGFQASAGRITFRAYCANCHGATGVGNGSIAKYLKVEPANLTLLSSDNEGVFPSERVYRVIDGREEVRTHGGRDMPIWGDVFQSSLAASPAQPGETPDERVTRKITELIRYLETIQVEADADEGSS